MWDFGIERALASLLEDADIRALVKNQEHRTTDEPSTFYGSPHFRQLDADCAGALTNRCVRTILLSLGGDGVQLLNWGKRTATVIAAKCEDMPQHLVQTGRAVTPLLIIEGPDEPSHLNHILMRTVDFLVRHAPSSDGTGELVILPIARLYGWWNLQPPVPTHLHLDRGPTRYAVHLSLYAVDLDGEPFVMKFPHPAHIASLHAASALSTSEVEAHSAVTIAAKHPRSKVKKEAADRATTRLEDAKRAARSAEEAARLAPALVQEHWYPVLVGLHGDTPFAAKLRRSVGAAAATGCPRCGLLASKKRPIEDGSPGDVTLKSTAYGGASCNAQACMPEFDIANPADCKLHTEDNFTYSGPDGSFNRQAAESILFDDSLDEMLAACAERIDQEELQWYQAAVRNRLHALGPDASPERKEGGMHHLPRSLPRAVWVCPLAHPFIVSCASFLSSTQRSGALVAGPPL